MILISVSVEEKMDLIMERLQQLKIPTSHAKYILPDQVTNIYYLTARGGFALSPHSLLYAVKSHIIHCYLLVILSIYDLLSS